MPETVFDDIAELVEPEKPQEPKREPEGVEDISYTDENWSNLVMSKFTQDEFIEINGSKYPTVNGLRRVCEKYLGVIVSSVSKVVQGPTISNRPSRKVGKRELLILEPAVVEHTIHLYLHDFHPSPVERVYTDCADAYIDNNGESEFLVHPTAIAATRAEARVLRKALKLKVVSAEEIVRKNKEVMEKVYKEKEDKDDADKSIDDNQRNVISGLADRTQIALPDYLKWKGIEDLTKLSSEEAKKLIAELSGWMKKWDKRPKELIIEVVQTPLN